MYKAAAAAAAAAAATADAWLMKLHAVQVGCGTNKKMVGWLEEEQEERRERQKSCYVCRPKMALPIKPEREREREQTTYSTPTSFRNTRTHSLSSADAAK
jgi:hypothetical protein